MISIDHREDYGLHISALLEASNGTASQNLLDYADRKLTSLQDHGSLDDFHLFGRLPAEVREMIWRHALSAPRVVEVQIDDREWHPAKDTLFLDMAFNPSFPRQGITGPLALLRNPSPYGFSLGNVKSFALSKTDLDHPTVWKYCFKRMSKEHGDPPKEVWLSPWPEDSSTSDSAVERELDRPPWFEGLQELIVVLGVRCEKKDLPRAPIKAGFEHKLREDSDLTMIPKVVVMSVDELFAERNGFEWEPRTRTVSPER